MLKQKSSLSAYRNYCHYLSHKHFFWRLEADVMWCCIEAVCGSKGLRTIAMIETSIKRDGVVRTERRCYIASLDCPGLRHRGTRPLGHQKRSALGARRHRQGGSIASQARPRSPRHDPRPTPRTQCDPLHARRNLDQVKTSIKGKRKLATWDTDYLANAIGLNPC